MDRYIAAARAICDNYDLYGYKESDFDPVQDIAETIDGFDAERDQTPASVEWLREVLGEPVEECCDEITYKQCTLWLDDDGSLQSIGFDCSTFCNPTRGDVLTALRLFKKEGV